MSGTYNAIVLDLLAAIEDMRPEAIEFGIIPPDYPGPMSIFDAILLVDTMRAELRLHHSATKH